VTGKTGEVLKKKAVDMPAVKERWEKICTRTDSHYYCVVRQEGGVLKFLGKEAWNGYLASKTIDTSILSLHCFIKGQSNSIFRNKFELRDRLGRFTTTTHAYTFGAREPPTSTGKDYVPEPVVVLAESRTDFVESKANSIKNIMDLATNTIVRYIQNMLGVTVLELSVDYVIDTKSQLWMLWTSDAKMVRTSNLATVTVPGLHTGDNTGRMSWAGNKYADDMKTMVLDGRVAGHTTSRSRSPSPGRPSMPRTEFDFNEGDMSMMSSGRNGSSHIDPLRNTVDAHGKVLSTKAATQVDSAMRVVEHDTSGKKKFVQNITVTEPHQKLIDPNKNQFPDAFKCKGEYCNIRFKMGGDLHAPSRLNEHVIEKCFTQKELELLRKDKNYGSMMDFSADGPGLATITQRSIIYAKNERRGMEESGEGGQTWKTYPNSPRDKNVTGVPSTAAATAIKNASLEEDMMHEAMLAKDRDHREEFTKQMVDYYKEVKVCGVCFKAYTTFDWARKLLGLDDAHGAGQERGARKKTPKKSLNEDSVSLAASDEDSIVDRKRDKLGSLLGGGVGEEKGGSPSRTQQQQGRGRSPSRGGSSPSPGRKGSKSRERDGAGGASTPGDKNKDKRTWKDYLDREDQGKTEKNHEQFADLDDYLRKGADKLATRKAKEKEAYMRKRVQQLAQADGSDAEDEDGNLRDNTETQNLYCGQVLLACEDNIHAFEAKSILEEAFFEVHLARDGRQALNDFQLRKESRFDAIIAQRDLPLGDAFEIVTAVRDIEKMERRKAAKDAANAGKGQQPYTKRYPIICYTDRTSPDDLKEYMKGDLDGCVSFPVNKMSLLNTVRAAIPHHLAQLDAPIPVPPPEGAKVYKLGPMGELEGANDSSTRAAETLPVSAKMDTDIAYHGVVQIDADTRVPYTVLDASKSSPLAAAQGKPFFNLIVIHDMFDTAERFKILLRPMVQKCVFCYTIVLPFFLVCA
jgi:CheY-like chemotaxis protein